MADYPFALTSSAALLSGGGVFNLFELRLPMTLIAAMWESDNSVLIAADSGVTGMYTGLQSEDRNKVRLHPSGAPLLWGISGMDSVADRFDEWLTEYQWPPQRWNDFQDDVTLKLAELNGEVRKRVEASGDVWSPKYTSGVLIASYLDSLRVFLINENGLIQNIRRERTPLSGVGSGALFAQLIHLGMENAYDVINQRPKGGEYEIFCSVVCAAVNNEKGCNFPIRMWRITKEKISELRLLKGQPASQS